MIVNDDGKQITGFIDTKHGMFSFGADYDKWNRNRVCVSSLRLDPLLSSVLEELPEIQTVCAHRILSLVNEPKDSFVVQLESIVQESLTGLDETAEKVGKDGQLTSCREKYLLQKWQNLVLSHISEVGWSSIESLAPDFTTVTLGITDLSGVLHSVGIELDACDYPDGCPRIVCPTYPTALGLKVKWNNHTRRTLAVLRDQLIQIFSEYDSHTDTNPTLTSASVSGRRNQTNNPLVYINEQHDDGDNIDVSAVNHECAICYTSGNISHGTGVNGTAIAKLAPAAAEEQEEENEEVSCSCDNSKCHKRFHKSCLRNWLLNVPNNKYVFGTLYGTCPYCSAAIHTRMY
mmetsp:Transcript_20518/g.34876  ORF Transcript_20518/g.34876 Transcript_20518/m.34876 type:complete len:346 (+) Transcript_20518:190-1227(+)